MENNKKTILTLLVLIVVVGFLGFKGWGTKDSVMNSAKGPKNTTYKIVGEDVTLKDGKESHPVAPGSASLVVTQYFGNEVKYDFDKDGREDTAFILTQDTGGSGTFYFLVYALNKESGYVGSEGLFIGDRIAPQTVELSREAGKEDMVIVNYADRNPGEGFDVEPSVGKSIYAKLDLKTMQPGQVVQNFEGEADPSKMNLGMKTWTWVKTEMNNGSIVKPKVEGKFNLTFKNDKTFSATTDCNGVGGEYDSKQNTLVFKNMISTLMYCDGSQEDVFKGYLENTASYLFTSKGELVLELKFDSGIVVFR